LINLVQVSAQVFRAVFILDDHFVSAFAAVNNAVQEGRPGSGDTPGHVAIIFGIVILEHSLDAFKRFPRNVSGVLILDHDFPVFQGQAFGCVQAREITRGFGASIDKGASVWRGSSK
jgi:hypothetical protein